LLGVALLSTAAACGDGNDSSGKAGDDGTEKAFEREWEWLEPDGAFCRDGSRAPLAVSVNPDSKDLMIFLEGGGACYDKATCLGSFSTVGHQFLLMGGLFDETVPNNPVKGWNMVYVPYCTGDSHAGTNPSGDVPGGPSGQKFVGYTNMGVFLKTIVPMFPNLERVLLTGISAGGFGASANAVQVMEAFPKDVKGILIDDSGPAMANKYLSSCLQDRWRTLWGLDDSMLKDCGDACPNKDDFMVDFSKHLAATYSDRKSGIIESSEDGIIRGFFGVGQNNCTASITDLVPAAAFTEGLLDFRSQLSAYPNFYTYYPNSMQHTWLSSPSLYSYSIGDVALVDWVTAIINDQPTSNVGP